MQTDSHASDSIPHLKPIESGFFETLRIMKKSYNSPLEHCQTMQKEHGNAVMQKMGKLNYVHLFGADANHLAVMNPNQILSNKNSWDLIIGRIFTNGLMLRDGDDHRYHRRIMQAGFKAKAMKSYMATMVDLVPDAIADWPTGDGDIMLAYPAFKQLTLDLAATIFLGMDLGDEATKINKAFETCVAASMPKIPVAFPGTILWRGIKAREYMCSFFHSCIAEKRAGNGNDMFSLLCNAKDEEGNQYTDQEIVDHMIFLMMAAHDTTTSTLTSMTYALAKNPEWQERLYQEVQSLEIDQLNYENLDKMVETEWVMKEALRMYPPLSTLPKFSLKEFEYDGRLIPAGAMVITYPIHTHYMDEYWDKPTTFDPLRFSEERSEQKRHASSWIPYSGGAHMCIGLHFAVMQIKLVMFDMLKRYRWSVPADYDMPVQQSPISKPKDGLPISLELR
ncbi:possible cytochrome P450 family proteins [marine gamma proteobacterium HTCC2143]|jgi:cytochrome P450|uniref:Possible cytochrome P450 family proteins n=1 Tax=marine gamma proteobacterium HTCC2143 TaxID=247633 RepID=A0YFK6_9GAMM|nr:possible cytochrome P450 family proteins [marine gamma proteobacterium HTCC2143]